LFDFSVDSIPTSTLLRMSLSTEATTTMSSISVVELVIVWVVFAVVFRIVLVYRRIGYNRLRSVVLQCQPPVAHLQPALPLRTLIVLGSGGHTSEILYMTKYLNKNQHFDPVWYCKASTDTTSKDRLYSTLQETAPSDHPTKVEMYNIPRSREVGQSYISSIYTTIVALVFAFKLIYKLKPTCIICNGPGTCIPICMVTILYRVLNILPNASTHVIFIESFCRVKTLSLTGRLLYRVSDVFMVHWKELQDLYPKHTIVTNSFIQ
jgi:beta-1,4-N-acetylglucosaminyltransferase